MIKNILLSTAVIVLALFNVFVADKNVTANIHDVSIFIEGSDANLIRVADLTVDYDKNNLELISSSAGGFLTGLSFIKKDEWADNRFLQLSTDVDSSQPVLRLQFRGKTPDIKLSSNSMVYLTGIGSTTLPNNKITYRIKYD